MSRCIVVAPNFSIASGRSPSIDITITWLVMKPTRVAGAMAVLSLRAATTTDWVAWAETAGEWVAPASDRTDAAIRARIVVDCIGPLYHPFEMKGPMFLVEPYSATKSTAIESRGLDRRSRST